MPLRDGGDNSPQFELLRFFHDRNDLNENEDSEIGNLNPSRNVQNHFLPQMDQLLNNIHELTQNIRNSRSRLNINADNNPDG